MAAQKQPHVFAVALVEGVEIDVQMFEVGDTFARHHFPSGGVNAHEMTVEAEQHTGRERT